MRDFPKLQNRRRSGNNNKRIGLAVILLALAFSGPASHAANETTLVLSNTTEAPFTTEAGDGFLDLVVGEAFRRTGLRMKLVKLPPERGLINANAGIEDGDLIRIAGLEKNYPNLVRVPEKLLDMHYTAFARQANLTEASWVTLEPFAVGYIKGWKIYEQNLKPNTHITTADDPNQLFVMLDKNRIDIALYERWRGYTLAKQMQLQGVRVVEPPLAVREMFIYLNKRHADKVPAISAALRAIKADGTYSRICREKFAPLAATTSQCAAK